MVEKYGLTLPEMAIFLALNDKGWFGRSENLIKYALSALFLFDLIETDRIVFRHERVMAVNTGPTGDPGHDKILSRIASSWQPWDLQDWIREISYQKLKIRRKILSALISRNIIRKEEIAILRVFRFKKFPVTNTVLKKRIQEDLAGRIKKDELNSEDLMLLSVMSSCSMIRKNFRHLSGYTELKKKIRNLLKQDISGDEKRRMILALHKSLSAVVFSSKVTIHT